MSGWLSIKFNNAFVFPDPELPINNILYRWSEYMATLDYVLFYFH